MYAKGRRRKSHEKVITKNPTYKKKTITKEEGARQNPRLAVVALSPMFFFSSSLVSNQPYLPPHRLFSFSSSPFSLSPLTIILHLSHAPPCIVSMHQRTLASHAVTTGTCSIKRIICLSRQKFA